MKLLHTSDWHIGRTLYGKQRYSEFSQFLDWLLETIKEQEVDVLLVAGDIFDTATPGTRAQELYYRFLCSAAATKCKHIIITSGNHDSPTFLSAPKEILKHLNISVVASTENINDEIIEVFDDGKELIAVICAVPYLRDRDIRVVNPGESVDDKVLNLVTSITAHYKEVCDLAIDKAVNNVPIIGMGHLFVTGGKTLADDGVRELYVGSLAHIGVEIFPEYLDYVALGHLHVPQIVGGLDHIRYCGSPIPMGFGEVKQQKKVIVVDFTSDEKKIEEIIVPRFQEIVRIIGDYDQILNEIEKLKIINSDAWLEIEYRGDEINPMLQLDIDEALLGSKLEVRVIKNRYITNKTLESLGEIEELENLSVNEVFNRCLDLYNVTDSEKPLLTRLYREIVTSITEDSNENRAD